MRASQQWCFVRRWRTPLPVPVVDISFSPSFWPTGARRLGCDKVSMWPSGGGGCQSHRRHSWLQWGAHARASERAHEQEMGACSAPARKVAAARACRRPGALAARGGSGRPHCERRNFAHHPQASERARREPTEQLAQTLLLAVATAHPGRQASTSWRASKLKPRCLALLACLLARAPHRPPARQFSRIGANRTEPNRTELSWTRGLSVAAPERDERERRGRGPRAKRKARGAGERTSVKLPPSPESDRGGGRFSALISR